MVRELNKKYSHAKIFFVVISCRDVYSNKMIYMMHVIVEFRLLKYSILPPKSRNFCVIVYHTIHIVTIASVLGFKIQFLNLNKRYLNKFFFEIYKLYKILNELF